MMTQGERAEQFAPFDAMKGLQEALRDREERHARVERHDISEEQIEKNSEVLSRVTKGTRVRVECYYAFHDIVVTGTVTVIDTIFRYMKVGAEKFPFSDIYSIEILDLP